MLDIVGGLVDELGGPGARGAIALDTSLDRDLGIGSLERVELLVRVEKELGVRLADAVIEEVASVGDLVTAVLVATPHLPEGIPALRPPLATAAAAPARARTLVEVLEWHATTHPDRVHVLLAGQDGQEQPITYGALWGRARAVAAGLRGRRIGPGERVALMLRTEAAFFDAFFGVLLAGGVPVPIYPPFRRDRMEEYAQRQVGILSNAEARVLITFRDAERVAGLLRLRVPSLRYVETVAALAGTGPPASPLLGGRDDPALIQYTSGSTGEPKGVLLSHANVLANIRAIGQAIAVRPDDVAVSWLPLYHDMGLIGSWLGALHFGIPIVVLSPLAFLSRPGRWLRALHAHRGTVSAAPNFAFDLCVSKLGDDEIEGLDLSAWRLALNGSESVSAETVERFTRRFAPHGFRAEALCPVYGLAEASVALTIPPLGRPPRIDTIAREPFQRQGDARPAAADQPSPLRFVSCGRPLVDHEVQVVDGAGAPLGERKQGRIVFRGPSVTPGYFRNPEATRAAVRDGWMDSGDLGYWADGELFVTGRVKDLIIKAGRNLCPQEVEEIVGAIAGVRKGCVAAFGVPDPAIGTERLIVVAESRESALPTRQRLRAAVTDRVVAALGIPPDTVVIAAPRSVLKTSSGKIRRSATREAYVTGALGRAPSSRTQWLRLFARDLQARAGRLLARGRDVGGALYLTSLLLPALPALWAAVLMAPTAGAADQVVKLWCRVILALAGCAIRVEGREHLATTGPAVLATNHGSYLDAVVLLSVLPPGVRFVAKRELLGTPLVGTIIRKAGHLTVERAQTSQSVADAERVTASLRGGSSVLVFPEGTFVRSPGVAPFRLGAFKSAVEAGRPVVPIAIRGTRDILPADRWLPRPGPVTVAVGPPLTAEGSGWPAIVRLRDATRAEIARRTGERLVER